MISVVIGLELLIKASIMWIVALPFSMLTYVYLFGESIHSYSPDSLFTISVLYVAVRLIRDSRADDDGQEDEYE